MFLFLWQQIAQNCQNNNIKIWWISESWDSVCIIIMVKVNTVMGVLHILYWSRKLLWEESDVLSQVCNVTFSFPGVTFPVCSFGAALRRWCCVTWGLWAAAPLQCCGCGAGCLHHCMQHVQPSGCALGLRTLAIGRLPSVWKAVCCCCSS